MSALVFLTKWLDYDTNWSNTWYWFPCVCVCVCGWVGGNREREGRRKGGREGWERRDITY